MPDVNCRWRSELRIILIERNNRNSPTELFLAKLEILNLNPTMVLSFTRAVNLSDEKVRRLTYTTASWIGRMGPKKIQLWMDENIYSISNFMLLFLFFLWWNALTRILPNPALWHNLFGYKLGTNINLHFHLHKLFGFGISERDASKSELWTRRDFRFHFYFSLHSSSCLEVLR